MTREQQKAERLAQTLFMVLADIAEADIQVGLSSLNRAEQKLDAYGLVLSAAAIRNLVVSLTN